MFIRSICGWHVLICDACIIILWPEWRIGSSVAKKKNTLFVYDNTPIGAPIFFFLFAIAIAVPFNLYGFIHCVCARRLNKCDRSRHFVSCAWQVEEDLEMWVSLSYSLCSLFTVHMLHSHLISRLWLCVSCSTKQYPFVVVFCSNLNSLIVWGILL